MKNCRSLRGANGEWAFGSLELIAEEPLMIRIDDKPYSVVMRTPGEELFHAAGFCLGEGIIDDRDDISAIGYDEHSDPNVADVWLETGRRQRIPDILRRRSFISQTSCGICGKQMIEEIYQKLTPAGNGFEIDAGGIFRCIGILSEKQRYYQQTRGSHAALILDASMEPVAFAEDVGRHNALDKAIGNALLSGNLTAATLVVLSSRTSHELVQKAARARLSMIVSHSRPTTLAAEMAEALDMTLVFPDKGSQLVVVSGEHRIRTKDGVEGELRRD